MEEASVTCGFQGGPHIRILGLGENLGQDEIDCFQSRQSSLKNITAILGLVAMTTQCSTDR